MLLGKGVLKLCSKVTGEHPCRSAISIKLQSNFIEITLRHGWSPPNLLHILRTPFLKNSPGRLLLLFFDGTSRNSMSCFWCILWRFHFIRVCNEKFSFYNFQTFLWMSWIAIFWIANFLKNIFLLFLHFFIFIYLFVFLGLVTLSILHIENLHCCRNITS